MMINRYFLIMFLICGLFFNLNEYAFSAQAPENVGEFFMGLDGQTQKNLSSQSSSLDAEGSVQSLPGVEVSPESMQKAFPNDLKQDAPRMDFIPDAAPLFPTLPLYNNEVQKNNAAPSISNPQTLPSLQLTKPSQDNTNNASGKNLIKINPEDVQKKDGVEEKANENVFENPSLELMVGQMIMAGFTGGELEKGSAILSLISEGKVGGVFLVASPRNNEKNNDIAKQENIYAPSQVRTLTATLQGAVEIEELPLFVAIEQEGGLVQTLREDLGFAGLAAAAKLGQGSVEQTEIAARGAGLEMAGLGINFALAPAGDVNLNPLSEEIGKRFRSFGPNSENVAAHVLAFGRGLVAAKVVPCLRNFPGMGSRMGGFSTQAMDNKEQNILYTIPDIGVSWQSRELVPYAKAAQSGWRGAIQPALVYHRAFDALHPVTLSRTLVQGILRGRLGYDGIVLSQDLRTLQPMYSLDDAVVQAVLAGADMILVTEPAHLKNAHGSLEGLTGIEGLGGLPMESMLGGNALTKELLKQSLGNAMPDMGFGGTLEQKVQTGHADEAAKVYEILLNAVRSGRVPMENIRASWRRIVKVKQEFLVD